MEKVDATVAWSRFAGMPTVRASREPLAFEHASAEAAFAQGNTARENKDYTEAMRLYRQAAAAGNASAMNNIGQLYQHGWGVPSDNGEALRWYRQSAERGNLAAINNIGSLYQKGLGVAADYGEAMRWCHQAADRGYATAMGNIGFSRKRG